jgi:NAD-dependent deacetylase
VRNVFKKRELQKKTDTKSQCKKSSEYKISRDTIRRASFTDSRVFHQLQGPQEIDYFDPELSVKTLPPIQAFAEPLPPLQAFAEPLPMSIEETYGWESSLINLDSIEKVAEIVSNSRNLMIFTGAGVSTESIKPTPGLIPLSRGTIEDLLQRKYYKILQSEEKDIFLETYLFGSILKILEARVGASHRAIADLIQILIKKGCVVNLVTQNVDYLHEAAAIDIEQNPNTVQHIHGWIKTATCPTCKTVHDYKALLNQLKETGNIDLLLCSGKNSVRCNGILTPDIVEYGEQVPQYDRYYQIAQTADTIIVAGTSLRVTPANQLVEIVHQHGGKVVVFDLYGTQMDEITDIHVQAQLEYAFPLLIWKLKDHISLESIGLSDLVLTNKMWHNFFQKWDEIERENPTMHLTEKLDIFRRNIDKGLEDPVKKIHTT